MGLVAVKQRSYKKQSGPITHSRDLWARRHNRRFLAKSGWWTKGSGWCNILQKYDQAFYPDSTSKQTTYSSKVQRNIKHQGLYDWTRVLQTGRLRREFWVFKHEPVEAKECQRFKPGTIMSPVWMSKWQSCSVNQESPQDFCCQTLPVCVACPVSPALQNRACSILVWTQHSRRCSMFKVWDKITTVDWL